MTSSFSKPVMLPVFIDDVQQPDVLCAGYIQHGSSYDGFRNKVEITPIRHDPRFICALEVNAVGQSYMIGVAHLSALIREVTA